MNGVHELLFQLNQLSTRSSSAEPLPEAYL